MNEKISITLRPFDEILDFSYISSTWLRGNRYGNDYFREIQTDLYYAHYAKVINNIMSDPNTVVTIACDSAYPPWIGGYSVFNKDALVWVFVKEVYRNKGIAKLLTEHIKFKEVKSITKMSTPIVKRKGLIFNPYFKQEE